MKRGWALWAAAAVSVSLLAGGTLRAQNNAGDSGFSYGDLKEVTLQGRVISLGDEMARKYGARVIGAGTEKQWGLALPEGQLYSFLDNEHYRKLAGANPANAAVEIKARQFPRSMLLEIVAFKPIPAETIRRRFYCRVCDISSEDFGPCACCGKEMEPVKK